MTDEKFASLRSRVSEFEDVVRRAREAKLREVPQAIMEQMLEHDPILQWRVSDFVGDYLAGGVYPEERLAQVVDRLIDTKLHYYYVAMVLPGTMNVMVYNRGFDPDDPLRSPELELSRLCYSQALIGQSRVLWERLMRCIYYLEEGQDPGGKSTRRKFFQRLSAWSPRWKLLAEWDTEIDRYDGRYRTPEYHKGSVLKAELLGGSAVDANDVLSLLTPVMNGFWPLLICNVSGRPHNMIALGRTVPAGQNGPAALGRRGREDHRPVCRRDDHPGDRDLRL